MALLRGYRLRRGPAVVLLVVVGLVGSAVILATQLRPSLEVYAPITVAEASTGTSYAVDDQVCVRAAQVSARLERVEVADEDLLTVALTPQGRPPVIAFPVDPSGAQQVEGTVVPARDDRCLRLLLRSTAVGEFPAPTVTVTARYGPFGLFTRSLDVVPPSTLVVTRTTPDPRLAP